ncbi:MAG: AAA family ATPase [Sulfurimonadaceae bacterium]|nr:AAA family ATPase [Sulfurimonadaceae bacterium]
MRSAKDLIAQVVEETQKIILGKEKQISLALSAYIADLHVLIEDIPGVGKTTLAKTLSHVLGLEYSRIQFTSDLLPSDILGVNFYNTKEGTFNFKRGPIFAQFLLADEINRASSKTQSALLEAMEEKQISIDGVAHLLPKPFFVVATKNPSEEIGTYELPSSQLDRFAISFPLGYPSHEAERAILQKSHKVAIESLSSLTRDENKNLKSALNEVFVDDKILDTIQEILAFTRESGVFTNGLSPRAALSMVAMCKSWALVSGREFVIPSDILEILPYITAHRLKSKGEKKSSKEIVDAIVANLTFDT